MSISDLSMALVPSYMLTATKGVTTAMTATKPPASLKPNHMMARKTMRMVGIVSIKGMSANSERSNSRFNPIAKPMPMPAIMDAEKVTKMRASVMPMS